MSTFALDSKKNVIQAENAYPGRRYYCPDCGKQLIVITGRRDRQAHFAHYKNQACTPEQEPEKKQPTKPQTWLADIYAKFPYDKPEKLRGENPAALPAVRIRKDNLSIYLICAGESSAPERETIEKDIEAGNKILLIINVCKELYTGTLRMRTDREGSMYEWDGPPAAIKWISPKEQKKDIAVFLYLSGPDTGKEEIRRITWTPDGANAWSYIVLDDWDTLKLTNGIKAEDVFSSAAERAWSYVQKRKVKSFIELYKGEKGKGNASVYKCPKNNDWVDVNKGCLYCPHALAVLYYTKPGDAQKSPPIKCNKIYCAYSEIVNTSGGKCKTFGHY